MDRGEAFYYEPGQRSPQFAVLATDDMRWDPSSCAPREPIQADCDGNVEHDGHARPPLTLRDPQKLTPAPGLDVRRVNDGEAPPAQPHLEGEVEQRKRILARRLVGLVVGDRRSEGI